MTERVVINHALGEGLFVAMKSQHDLADLTLFVLCQSEHAVGRAVIRLGQVHEHGDVCVLLKGTGLAEGRQRGCADGLAFLVFLIAGQLRERQHHDLVIAGEVRQRVGDRRDVILAAVPLVRGAHDLDVVHDHDFIALVTGKRGDLLSRTPGCLNDFQIGLGQLALLRGDHVPVCLIERMALDFAVIHAKQVRHRAVDQLVVLGFE